MAAPTTGGRQRGRGLALIHPTPAQISMPEWYADFEKQYRGRAWKEQRDEKPRSDPASPGAGSTATQRS